MTELSICLARNHVIPSFENREPDISTLFPLTNFYVIAVRECEAALENEK